MPKTVRMSFKGILDQMKSAVMKGYDCSTCKVSSKMSVLKASCRILQVKQSAIRLQMEAQIFPDLMQQKCSAQLMPYPFPQLEAALCDKPQRMLHSATSKCTVVQFVAG